MMSITSCDDKVALRSRSWHLRNFSLMRKRAHTDAGREDGIETIMRETFLVFETALSSTSDILGGANPTPQQVLQVPIECITHNRCLSRWSEHTIRFMSASSRRENSFRPKKLDADAIRWAVLLDHTRPHSTKQNHPVYHQAQAECTFHRSRK